MAGETVPLVKRDGTTVQIPAADAGAAIRTGEFGVADGTKIPVQGADGKIELLEGSQAVRALSGVRGIGSESVGQGQYTKQVEGEKYGSVGSTLAAGGLGLLSGLTFGAAPGVIKGAIGLVDEGSAKDFGTYAQKVAEYNPGADIAGNVVGAIAPTIIAGIASGGSGGVASGAATVARLGTGAARAGTALAEGAGLAAARGLTRLGAAEAGLATRIAQGAVTAGVEGALYGAGSAYSQAALRDDPITAQKILAGAGHGALAGAAIGGAISGLGGALFKGAAKGEEAAAAQTAIREETALANKLADGVPAPGFRGTLEAFAQKAELKATGANKKLLAEIAERPEAVQARAAAQIRNELPEIAGKDFLKLSKTELAQAAESNLAKKGEEVGALLRKADETIAKIEATEGRRVAVELSPLTQTVVKEARESIVPAIEAKIGGSDAAKRVTAVLDDIEKKIQGSSFEAIHKARRELDDLIKWEGKAGSTDAQQGLQKVRAALENEIKTGLDRIGEKTGSKFALEYQAAKESYQAANWLAKATTEGAARETANRTLGLSEQIGGVGGALLGAVSAGPVGAALGLAGAGVQWVIKNKGDQIASTLARKALGQETALAAINRTDQVIGRTLTVFFAPSAQSIAKPLTATTAIVRPEKQAPIQSTVTRTEFAAKPSAKQAPESALGQRYQKAVADVPRVGAVPQGLIAGLAPEVRAQIEAGAARGRQWLEGKIPQDTVQAKSLMPNVTKSEVPPSEQARFLRYKDAVDNPLGAIEKLKSGDLTPDHVEAIKSVYPDLYQDLRDKVVDFVAQRAETGKDLPYQQKAQLSILLGTPTDATLTPEFISAVQSSFAPIPPQNSGAHSNFRVSITNNPSKSFSTKYE